eukprot:885317-Pelagomonas_calceolata.AAC.6
MGFLVVVYAITACNSVCDVTGKWPASYPPGLYMRSVHCRSPVCPAPGAHRNRAGRRATIHRWEGVAATTLMGWEMNGLE